METPTQRTHDSWLRTKRSMMWFLQPMIIKLSMSRPCAEQTVVAMLICKLPQPGLLLSEIMHEQSCSSIFVSLLISIDQMSFVTLHWLLLPHCLEPWTMVLWVKIINVSMKVQFTVKSVMFTMFPPCQCPSVPLCSGPRRLKAQSIFTKRFKFGPVVRCRN